VDRGKPGAHADWGKVICRCGSGAPPKKNCRIGTREKKRTLCVRRGEEGGKCVCLQVRQRKSGKYSGGAHQGLSMGDSQHQGGIESEIPRFKRVGGNLTLNDNRLAEYAIGKRGTGSNHKPDLSNV